MAQGLHIIKTSPPGKPCVWYVYAYRGGPQLLRKVGGSKPKITAEMLGEAKASLRRPESTGTLTGLIIGYRRFLDASDKADQTKADERIFIGRIEQEWSDTPIDILENRRFRAAVLDWRDANWQHQPRTADKVISQFARLLNHAVDRGDISVNVLAGVRTLYRATRADIIWTEEDIAKLAQHASRAVMQAVRLAACTGLRREDLVKLTWSAIGRDSIIWHTSKSRKRKRIAIPLLDETRALLAELPRREATDTVLTSTRGTAWTPDGLQASLFTARKAAGIDKHLHDLRGTFATRLTLASLSNERIDDILGWEAGTSSRIRKRYIDEASIVIDIAERLRNRPKTKV
jgi:integrase